MKIHPSIPAAAVCLLSIFVSSCGEGEVEEVSPGASEAEPATEVQPPKEEKEDVVVENEASEAPAIAQEPAVPATPPASTEKSDETLTGDEKTLRTKDYYNDENLAAAKDLIEKMTPEMKESILAEMKAGKKIAAVKIAREQSKTSLAVNKLTVELIAIEAGVSAGF